jgi:ferredoxin
MTRERSFRVVLETPESIRSFDCIEEGYIWDASAANGIVLPAICHQGRCLSCAGRLLEGTVEHDHLDAYLDEDKAAGYILLCRALARCDVRILTHQEWKMREHPSCERLACSLRLSVT